MSHRLSTIRNADHTLVMDQEKIVKQGTDDELLTHEGAYRRLYEIQFSEPSYIA